LSRVELPQVAEGDRTLGMTEGTRALVEQLSAWKRAAT